MIALQIQNVYMQIKNLNKSLRISISFLLITTALFYSAFADTNSLQLLLGRIIDNKVGNKSIQDQRTLFLTKQSDSRYGSGIESNYRPEVVKGLQELLNSNGANLTVDGKFGTQTKQALKDFQERWNQQNATSPGFVPLKADGVIGPDTANALREATPRQEGEKISQEVGRGIFEKSLDIGAPNVPAAVTPIAPETGDVPAPKVEPNLQTMVDSINDDSRVGMFAQPNLLPADSPTQDLPEQPKVQEERGFFDTVLNGIKDAFSRMPSINDVVDGFKNTFLNNDPVKEEQPQQLSPEIPKELPKDVTELLQSSPDFAPALEAVNNNIAQMKELLAKIEAMPEGPEQNDALAKYKEIEVRNDNLMQQLSESVKKEIQANKDLDSQLTELNKVLDPTKSPEVVKPEDGGKVEKVETLEWDCELNPETKAYTKNCKKNPEKVIKVKSRVVGAGELKIFAPVTENVKVGDEYVQKGSLKPVENIQIAKVKQVIINEKTKLPEPAPGTEIILKQSADQKEVKDIEFVPGGGCSDDHC